jgi:lipopolysaccharide/colanic/teichoic acid biosynthesis glycosyltransferase
MSEIRLDYTTKPLINEISAVRHPNYVYVKRNIDFILSAILLLLSSPLFLLLALGIKLHTPGPVFYRQKRIGKDGRPFDMLKLRSMRVGNDSKLHQEHVQYLIRNNIRPQDLGVDSLKLKSDPRITGLGKIMRKLSLDELPQLINVMRGEMSIVGPRPPLPYEYELYSAEDKKRLSVTPGITGLWQVTAHNTVSFAEMVQIDMNYIKNMSLRLDLEIILKTPFEMLQGKGGG